MYSDQDLYKNLIRIRKFEEFVLENFHKGYFPGTTHSYLGQEANAVGVLENIQVQDIVVSNHRCHGHFLAYGGTMYGLLAEMMGKSTGVCAGRGGSQHLHWKKFYSNGIQGGFMPIAVGMAMANKFGTSDSITINFIGDGTLGEGILYETLNMASLWEIPVLFVLENNKIAQTTPIEMALSGTIQDRFQAFGIQSFKLESSDVREILPQAEAVINATRQDQKPYALILDTHRFGPHSKGDDTRSAEEIQLLVENHDPILIQKSRLNKKVVGEIEHDVQIELESAFERAISDPDPVL